MNNTRAKKLFSSILGSFLLTVATPLLATPINPDPAIYGADDGSTYFFPTPGGTVGFEYFDWFSGEMGFFYSSDPGTLIPIFETSDQNTGTTPQSAFTDFSAGEVYDFDESILQNSFTPKSDPIAFYLKFGTTVLQTVTANGNLDLAATFPLTTGLGYAITFYVPDPNATGGTTSLASYYMGNLLGTPQQIPEPSTFLLLGGGLLGIVFRLSRSRKKPGSSKV